MDIIFYNRDSLHVWIGSNPPRAGLRLLVETPDQCNKVYICNERPVGKIKPAPTTMLISIGTVVILVLDQISFYLWFKFPYPSLEKES